MKFLRNLTSQAFLIGFALSSQYAFAQATYNYTGGNFYTDMPPFTTSMRVSATLQLGSWLPPNQSCMHVSSLPGFRLIMNDGVDTFDTSSLPVSAATALVSTDSQGQITYPWLVSLGNVLSTAVAGSDQLGQTCPPLPPILDSYDWAISSGAMDEAIPGRWSYPNASALAIMLTSEINLQYIEPGLRGKSLSNKLAEIRNDLTTNNGYACSDLASFVNEVMAQTGKKITAAQSAFILHTVAIMQSELSCGG